MSEVLDEAPPDEPEVSAWAAFPHGEARLDAALEQLDGITAAHSNLFALEARTLVAAAQGAREADADLEHGMTTEFLATHVAGTLTVRRCTAQDRLNRARHLVVLLPGTCSALEDAWLRVPQALVIIEETSSLTPAQCARVEAEVLPWAPDRTPGDIRRRVRRVVKRLVDQAQAEKDRRRAVAERAVASTALDDGMAGVWATMPAGAERLFMTALRQLAERVKTADDTRTAAQRESDVLAALPSLVLDGLTGGLGPEVQQALAAHGFRPGGKAAELPAVLLVPAATALGQSDEPGELVGYGPVTAEHARALLRTATVRTATVDEHGRIVALSEKAFRPSGDDLTGLGLTGETAFEREGAGPGSGYPGNDGGTGDRAQPAWRAWLLEHLGEPTTPPADEPQYRPSAALRRLVGLRDPHCIGIGCSTPAWRCDVEHRIPWPHGPTGPGNTGPVSRRCHRIKQAGWTYVRSRDGTTIWAAPNGRTYRRPGTTWVVPPVHLPA
jgi:hypothetical protein